MDFRYRIKVEADIGQALKQLKELEKARDALLGKKAPTELHTFKGPAHPGEMTSMKEYLKLLEEVRKRTEAMGKLSMKGVGRSFAEEFKTTKLGENLKKFGIEGEKASQKIAQALQNIYVKGFAEVAEAGARWRTTSSQMFKVEGAFSAKEAIQQLVGNWKKATEAATSYGITLRQLQKTMEVAKTAKGTVLEPITISTGKGKQPEVIDVQAVSKGLAEEQAKMANVGQQLSIKLRNMIVESWNLRMKEMTQFYPSLTRGERIGFGRQALQEVSQQFTALGQSMGFNKEQSAMYNKVLSQTVGEISKGVSPLREFGRALNQVFYFGSAAMILYGLQARFREIANEVLGLDEAFSKLSAILVDSGENLSTLESKAYGLATAFGVTVQTVAETMTELAKVGLRGGALEGYTRLGLLAQNVLGMNLQEYVKGATAAVENFGAAGESTFKVMTEEGEVSIKQVGEATNDLSSNLEFSKEVLDKWTNIAHHARIGAQDLVEALQTAGVAASGAGLNFDQFNAMVTTVIQSTGLAGKMVSRYLQYAFAGLQGPEAQRALEQIGIKVKDDVGNFRSFSDVIDELSQRWQNLLPTQQLWITQSIAGKWRYAPLLALLNNYSNYLNLVGVSQHSMGRATEENARIQQAFSRQITRVKEAFVSIGASFRTVLMPFMTLIGLLAKLISGFNTLTQHLPTPLKMLVNFGESALVASAAVKGIGAALGFRGAGALSLTGLAGEATGIISQRWSAIKESIGGVGGAFAKLKNIGSSAIGGLQNVLSGFASWIAGHWVMIVLAAIAYIVYSLWDSHQKVRALEKQVERTYSEGAQKYYPKLKGLEDEMQLQKEVVANAKKEVEARGSSAEAIENLNIALNEQKAITERTLELNRQIAKEYPGFVTGFKAGEPQIDTEAIERTNKLAEAAKKANKDIDEYRGQLKATIDVLAVYSSKAESLAEGFGVKWGWGWKAPLMLHLGWARDVIVPPLFEQTILEREQKLKMRGVKAGTKAYTKEIMSAMAQEVLNIYGQVDEESQKVLDKWILAFQKGGIDILGVQKQMISGMQDYNEQIEITSESIQTMRSLMEGFPSIMPLVGGMGGTKGAKGWTYLQKNVGQFEEQAKENVISAYDLYISSAETYQNKLKAAKQKLSVANKRWVEASMRGDEKEALKQYGLIKKAQDEVDATKQTMEESKKGLAQAVQDYRSVIQMIADSALQTQLMLQGVNLPLEAMSNLVSMVSQYAPGMMPRLRNLFGGKLQVGIQNLVEQLGQARGNPFKFMGLLGAIQNGLGMLWSMGEETASSTQRGMSAAEKASTKFNAAQTMLQHMKTMEKVTYDQYIEGLKTLYAMAPTPDDKLKIEEEIYQAEKDRAQQRVEYARAWVDHQKALELINDQTRIEYLKQIERMATTREERWRIEEEIYQAEKDLESNRVSKAEAWAKHQQQMGRLTDEGVLEIYREILRTMGSKVPEDVRWRIEEEIHNLENKAKEESENIEKSIFRRAAGLLAPFRISYKEYKKLLGEGAGGLEQALTGGNLLEEFKNYMTESIQPTADLNQEVQNMIQSELNGQISTQALINEMTNYANQALALAEAERAASDATNQASNAFSGFVENVMKQALNLVNSGDMVTQNATSVAGALTELAKNMLNFKATFMDAVKNTIGSVMSWFLPGGVWPNLPIPHGAATAIASSSTSAVTGAAASLWAQSQEGKPYKWATAGPDTYDCSGLVYWAYGKVGKPVPRTTWSWRDLKIALNAYTNPFDWAWLTKIPGALLFVKNWSHMAMATGLPGDKAVIEAGGKRVHYSALSPERWPWVAWPLRSGGEVRGDNVPALLHDKEVVVNSNLVRKMERFFSSSGGVNYVNNATYNINGTGLNEEQLRRVLDKHEEENTRRFAKELRRYI